MNHQFGVGFIPYEINDRVILHTSSEVVNIEDIRMIQYLKDRKIEFEVMIGGTWILADEIKKRIIQKEKNADPSHL